MDPRTFNYVEERYFKGVKAVDSEEDVTSSEEEEEEEDSEEEDEGGRPKLTDEERHAYYNQIRATEGFDVDHYGGLGPGMIIPATNKAQMPALSAIALNLFNQSNGVCYEFVKTDKANLQPNRGVIYYITFTAKNCEDGSFDHFQTRVWKHIPGPDRLYVAIFELCRIKGTQGNTGRVVCHETDSENGLGEVILGERKPVDSSDRTRNLVRAYAKLALHAFMMRGGGDDWKLFKVNTADVETSPPYMVDVPFCAMDTNFYITFSVKDRQSGLFRILNTWICTRAGKGGSWNVEVRYVHVLA